MSYYIPYSRQTGSGYVMLRTVLPNGQWVQVRHATYRTPKRAVGTGMSFYVPYSQTDSGYVILRTMLPNGQVVRHTVLAHRCAHRPREKARFASRDCSDSAQATVSTTLRAPLSGTFLQTLPDLVMPQKGPSLSPRSCPLTRSAPSERFGY